MAIAGEVLDFLHSKSSRPLVQKLFVVAECVLYDAMADGADSPEGGFPSVGDCTRERGLV